MAKPRRAKRYIITDPDTALSHPVRRRVIDMLVEAGSMPATQIGKKLGFESQAGSNYLTPLRDSGLAVIDYRGTSRIYSLDLEAVLEATRWQAELHEHAKRLLAEAADSGPGPEPDEE